MKLRHVLQIDVPPELVWAVTEDIEHWPQWTPTVHSVQRLDQGPLDVGSRALLKQPGLSQATWVVTSLTRGKRFSWESRIRGIRFVATHLIVPTETGTQSELQVEMSGLMVFLLWPLLRWAVQRSLEQENTGLKKRCEALASSSCSSEGDSPQPTQTE